ncbi:hypothetical protein DPQ33_02645 [Oceanidesulfovibrio indonesiensis]|uniref:histidine kinase n=1 Tax=Oceanidesulfovibrio indonesiensis TaxID=54767 RepID=A0A7M3MII7_9BACT|nr:PAS domain S-box protein [Oceanidesulfovibrio indonesiensis]TVM19277.1 hypothetical protein DPQ33_02645 [Oceanidesulfovibrio indonesiensis]
MNHDGAPGGGPFHNGDLKTAVDAIAGIMEGTSDLIAVADSDLRLLVFNQSYRTSFFKHFCVTLHTGDSLEEALAHLPDVQQSVVANWRRALSGDSFTVDQFGSGDRQQWYETRYTPVLDRNGAVVGVSHISRSLSERIRTETELRESEEKFRVLFENAADAIYLQDTHGRFFDANQKAVQMLGYTKDELLRMSPRDIDSPADAKKVPERLERIWREGELTFETVHVRKDGASVPVEVSSNIIQFAGRQAILSVVRDLAERNRAMEAVREREELYRGLFLNEHMPMMLIEPETGRVVEANPAAAEFYGYQRESLHGMRVSDFNPIPVEDIRDNIKQALDFVTNRFELTHRLASGALRNVEIFTGPVHIKGRRLLYSIITDVTARKRMENALRESEERFRLVVENSRDGIHMLDLKTQRNTFASPAQAELTGFSHKELLEMTVSETFDRLHPEDREWVETYLNQVVKGEDPGVPVEYRWKVKSGEYRWFSDSRRAIPDEQGRAVALVGVSRDVTWRKEMEDQLIQAIKEAGDARRESERRTAELQAALQSAPIGTIFYNPDQTVNSVNKSAELLLGYSLEDLKGLSTEERIKSYRLSWTDHTPFRVEDSLAYRALHGETVADEEFLVYPRGSETPIHVLSQAAPIVLDGEIVGAVQIIADITERKQTEEALRESEKRYRALIDASAQVVYRMSPDWSEMRQLRGGDFLANTEGPNRNWMHEYIHPDDRDFVLGSIKTAVESETTFELEHRVIRADGTMGWTSSRAVPVRGENGEVVEWFGAASDVTERKRIEEDLSRAKQEADRASQAKSEFLANMSHEIRTPLTGLLGMTDLLLDSLKIEKNIEYVRYMKRAGEALRIIIDDVLDLSKIEAGRMEFKPAPVKITESVRQAVALFEPMAREKGLDWTISLAPDLPEVVSIDEPKLHQVLRNLVSNAIKFTERGGITVEVKHAEAAGQGELRIEVRDTGVGIPEARRHELFQEFTQLDSSYQKIHGGTGLGLAISKQLVELMGGWISFKSEHGVGSTFIATIPAPEAALLETAYGDCMDIQGCEHLRILAAEDNPINQFLIREMLSQAGCSFTLVENGQKVLEELEQAPEPYDLVLMDINMPELNGMQTTKLIRESGKPYADVTVIALTAYAMPEERERFLACGLDGYLAKPFTIRQLLAALNELPCNRILARLQGVHGGETAAGKPVEEAARPERQEKNAVLDQAYLVDHFDGNRDGLLALIELVEEDTPGQLEALQGFLDRQHWAEAADQAHYMAGGFRTVGLLHVADECLRLEQLLRDNSIDAAERICAMLEAKIEESIDAVRQWAGA